MGNMSMTVVIFDTEISPAEVPYFRGCIIRLTDGNQLSHNHRGTGYNYTYPLVQYKRLNRHAAVVGINEGAEMLAQLMKDGDSFDVQLGNRPATMTVISVRNDSLTLTCGAEHIYSIDRWIPLNEANYATFLHMPGVMERMEMLERILIGNILSFAKSMGVFFEKQVKCRILQLEEKEMTTYKNVEFMTFSAIFACNVTLPDYIGLGKSASVGRGTIRQHNNRQL